MIATGSLLPKKHSNIFFQYLRERASFVGIGPETFKFWTFARSSARTNKYMNVSTPVTMLYIDIELRRSNWLRIFFASFNTNFFELLLNDEHQSWRDHAHRWMLYWVVLHEILYQQNNNDDENLRTSWTRSLIHFEKLNKTNLNTALKFMPHINLENHSTKTAKCKFSYKTPTVNKPLGQPLFFH